MDTKFSQSALREALARKCPNPAPCPFCGSKSYVPYSKFTMLQIQSESESIQFGQAIPAGVVICNECGHINLFALGALDLKP